MLERRDFLKSWFALLPVTIMTNWNCKNKSEPKPIDSLPFEEHFQLSIDELYKILNIALSKGGRFADIYMEFGRFHLINMEEDIIKETDETIQFGLGIRVISGEKTGYGYTNDLSLPKVKEAALTAASIASSSFKNSRPLKKQPFFHNSYRVIKPAHFSGFQPKISLVKQAYQAAQKTSPLIKKIKTTLSNSIQYIT
ncbi:MAG: PmbA/TldA family metallopeptidase, partial [Acidobacteriota bacterium]